MFLVRLVFILLALHLINGRALGKGQHEISKFDQSARYFHPVWLPHLGPALSEIPPELVMDPNEKLPEALQVPPLLRPRVYFWMQIYGRFSSWHRVLHDREEPSLIYGYIDCSALFEGKKSRMQREILCSRIEKKLIQRMRNLLTRLDRNPSLRSFILSHSILEGDLPKLSKRLRSQTGQKDIYLLALQRSQALIPLMENKFEHSELPSHLSRIPFVESSFHPKATSKVKAMGIWQFMPNTAKEYIHRSDKTRWTDPIHQTDGAVKLFRRNQRALGDWGLTVTSYNSGVGRVMKLSKKYELKNIQELLFLPEPSRRLGFAGKNFYAEFLAANLLYNYQQDTFYSEILSGPIQSLMPTPLSSCTTTKYSLY